MSVPTTETAKGTAAEVTQVAVAVPDTHPPAFWFFFWGEFAERSSYYGMRAILLLYLMEILRFPAGVANPIYFWFKMGCYFLPLVGGYLADRFFGKYWTIVGFSVPYIMGHFILGWPNRIALAIALVLLACGSGVIKPNISTLMGMTYDQKRPGKAALRTAAFLWFYFAINVGALISQIALPAIRAHYAWDAEGHVLVDDQGNPTAEAQRGYAIAFQVPAWLMVGSFLTFALGKRFYGVEEPGRREISPEERREQWNTLMRLFGIFALMIFFWMAYEHNDTLWVLFARDYVNRHVFWQSRPVPPDQIQSLNPAFVLILIPLFNVLFRWLDPQVHIFTPMRKILAGFALTAAASGIVSAAAFLSERAIGADTIRTATSLTVAPADQVSIVWMVVAYIVLTVAEVLLYGTMLELAYAAAPPNMKSFVTACFLVTNTLGNLLNSFISPLYGGSLTDPPDERGRILPGQFFGLTALVVVVATIGFYFVGRRFERGNASANGQMAV
jgi:POT family proton-dependent oligopeptide transporter